MMERRKKQKSKASKIIGIILDVVLVLMVLYIGVTLYLRSTTDNKQASIFGITTHVIISGSMEPEISKDDIIIVKRSKDYSIGDIVTYIREDGLSITHRIIGVSLDGYILKGDANPSEDPGIIKKTQIVGRVIALIPGDGGWIRFIKNETSKQPIIT